MYIKVLEQTWEYENESLVIDEIFRKLDDFLSVSELHINHMVIDGHPIYEDFQDYILDNIKKIQLIEVKVNTIKQLNDDILITSDEYLSRALPIISELSNDFYRNPTEDTWNEFDNLLEGIQWLFQAFEPSKLFSSVFHNLQMVLTHLFEAVEYKDMTLIGDILNYEIIKLLESLHEEVKKIIDNEVVRNDLS